MEAKLLKRCQNELVGKLSPDKGGVLSALREGGPLSVTQLVYESAGMATKLEILKALKKLIELKLVVQKRRQFTVFYRVATPEETFADKLKE